MVWDKNIAKTFAFFYENNFHYKMLFSYVDMLRVLWDPFGVKYAILHLGATPRSWQLCQLFLKCDGNVS